MTTELKGYLYDGAGAAVAAAVVNAYAPGTVTPSLGNTTTDAAGMWRFDAGGANALTAPGAALGYDVEIVSGGATRRVKFEDKLNVMMAEMRFLRLRDADGTNRATFEATALTADRALTVPNLTGTLALLENPQTFAGAKTFDGALVFNEPGANVDARFEGDTDVNLLFLDASTDRIGIGTATPGVKLDVVGLLGLQNVGGFRATLDPVNITGNRALLIPDVAGTLAIMAGTQTFSGAKTFTAATAFAAVTVSGGATPAANDGGALGASGTAWSDLFLASGAVINFNAGDVTLTHAANLLTLAGGGMTFDGAAIFNSTATFNAGMTFSPDLLIDQGAGDGHILTLESDVGHGITTEAGTDVFGVFKKVNATEGGLHIVGLKDGDAAAGDALRLAGYLGEPADTTKSVVAVGVVSINAAIQSGTGITNVNADGNLAVILNNSSTAFIFDAEGSGHAFIDWITYDAEDDVLALRDFEAVMLPERFGEALQYNREAFERLGIVGRGSWKEEGGRLHAMVNFTKLAMLHHGALIQMAKRLVGMEQRVALMAGGA